MMRISNHFGSGSDLWGQTRFDLEFVCPCQETGHCMYCMYCMTPRWSRAKLTARARSSSPSASPSGATSRCASPWVASTSPRRPTTTWGRRVGPTPSRGGYCVRWCCGSGLSLNTVFGSSFRRVLFWQVIALKINRKVYNFSIMIKVIFSIAQFEALETSRNTY